MKSCNRLIDSWGRQIKCRKGGGGGARELLLLRSSASRVNVNASTIYYSVHTRTHTLTLRKRLYPQMQLLRVYIDRHTLGLRREYTFVCACVLTETQSTKTSTYVCALRDIKSREICSFGIVICGCTHAACVCVCAIRSLLHFGISAPLPPPFPSCKPKRASARKEESTGYIYIYTVRYHQWAHTTLYHYYTTILLLYLGPAGTLPFVDSARSRWLLGYRRTRGG